MKKKLVSIFVVILVLSFAIFIVVRAAAPTGIAYDPADKGYCEAYRIEIDPTQVPVPGNHPG